jgi:clan AA aspartic protease
MLKTISFCHPDISGRLKQFNVTEGHLPRLFMNSYDGGVMVGAVRVKVKITNGSDEALARTGQLRPEDVRSYEGEALVDTGAVDNVIPVAVMQRLGLPPVDRRSVRYADGHREVVDIAAPLTIYVLDRSTFGQAFVLGDEILLGQIALEAMDLLVDCASQTLIPNPKHPEGPVFRI